ncbi:MAG: hypothetical protein F4Y58_00905 [Gammaproteobacteria bacterium]|nr:hypothetical protein [Gammaproteobacteria bacterium]
MLTTKPVTTPTPNQSPTVARKQPNGAFADRNVSVATSDENFIPPQATNSAGNLSSPTPVHAHRVRQPEHSADQKHYLTTTRPESNSGQTALDSEEAVKSKAAKLASDATSVSQLNDHITDCYNKDLITPEQNQTFTTLAKYNEVLDKQMLRMEYLGNKLSKNKASTAQINELNALLKSQAHNLSLVQTYLAKLPEESGSPEANALTSAFGIRFTERHMTVADLTAFYSGKLPDQEPISKGDRIGYSLLQARGCLRALEKMTLPRSRVSSGTFERMRDVIKEHCRKLERAEKFQKGEIDPTTDTSSWELLTDDFTLVKDKKKLSSKVLSPLNKLWDKHDGTNRVNTSKLIPLTHPKISQPKMIELFVRHQLKAAGIAKREMSNLPFLLRQGIVEEINNGEWPTVDKEMKFKVAGTEHTARSTITPAGRLAARFGAKYKSNGISSMDRMQYQHVPNMAHSEMTSAKGDATFSGIRHGVLDPFMINEKNLRNLPAGQLSKMVKELLLDTGAVTIPEGRNPSNYASVIAQQIIAGDPEIPNIAVKMRDESSKMMAKELLTAAVVANPQKLEAALNGDVIDVALNSISLITPDKIRGFLKPQSPSDEKAMMARQTASLKNLAASGELITLKVRDEEGITRSIQVRPKVRTFSFGVNQGAIARSKGVLGPSTPLWGKAMGWEFAAAMNNPELRDLLGDPRSRELGGAVAAKITEMRSGDEATRKKASLLQQTATQVKEIWSSQSFRRGGVEPYKMVSRLALMSHLMGETPLYNCKSGKDRTGQLDAEVKYLASVGNTTGQIPRPETAHTAESRRMRTNFALNTGNHEVQQMSVGLKGYKLKGVPGLNKMMETEMMDIYRGGSKFVQT